MKTVGMLDYMDMLVLCFFTKLQQPAKVSLDGDFMSYLLVYTQPGE